MGFHTVYLPEIKELKEQFVSDPETTKARLVNADAMVGPTNSIKYAERIIHEKDSPAERIHKRKGIRTS